MQGGGLVSFTSIFRETFPFFSGFTSVSDAESVSVSESLVSIFRLNGSFLVFRGRHEKIVGIASGFRRFRFVSGLKSSGLKCAEHTLFCAGSN